MNRFRKTIIGLLREHGAVLVRQRKHKVYRLDGGQTYVESSSPSDRQADSNQLRDLKRVLDLPKEAKPSDAPATDRRSRREPRPGRREPVRYEKSESVSPSFAEKLRASGAIEAVLRDEIAMNLEHIEVLEARIAQLEARKCGCWWCRLRARVGAE